MAFYYFHKEKLNLGVIEVGMGGKRDATNVFERPIVSLFTSISMDHAQVLGVCDNTFKKGYKYVITNYSQHKIR